MNSSAAPDTLDAKSRKIIDVARGLFLTQGFAATSMDEVAAAAQMSKTTLYKRYPSKVLLFAATITALGRRSGLDFDPSTFDDSSIDDTLFEIGVRFFDLVCQPDSLRLELVYHSEGSLIPKVAAAFRRNGPEWAVKTVERFFRHAIRKEKLALTDPHFAAMQFLVLIRGDPFGLSHYRKDLPTTEEKETRIRRIVQMFLDGARLR